MPEKVTRTGTTGSLPARIDDRREYADSDGNTRRDESRSSPAPDAGSDGSTRCSSPREGAKVVVNDLGGAEDGSGSDAGPAQQVVDEIKAMGGEAVANTDSCRRLGRWPAPHPDRDRHVRRAARAREQRGHPPRPHDHQHVRGGVGRRDPRPPEGPLRAVALRGRVLARPGEGGHAGEGVGDQHVVDFGSVRQRRPDQLRRGEDRHRDAGDHRPDGARPLRRARQRDRTVGDDPAHPDDPRRREPSAAEGGRVQPAATRATSRRSSPTSPPRTARSRAGCSSCPAAT